MSQKRLEIIRRYRLDENLLQYLFPLTDERLEKLCQELTGVAIVPEATECDCPCHTGAHITHSTPCCEGQCQICAKWFITGLEKHYKTEHIKQWLAGIGVIPHNKPPTTEMEWDASTWSGVEAFNTLVRIPDAPIQLDNNRQLNIKRWEVIGDDDTWERMDMVKVKIEGTITLKKE